MSSRFHRRKSAPTEPTVNLTPLIDVVFVILIMFIVLAPLLELEHVNLASASSNAAGASVSVQQSSPIAIHVLRDNSIIYDQKKIAIDDLSFKLKEAREQYPSVRPQLFHDKGAYFGTYQSIKNAAEEAGFHEIDLILKPD